MTIGLFTVDLVCWLLATAILYLVADPGGWGWLQLAVAPYLLLPDLPKGFVVISLMIGLAPFAMIALAFLKREVCAFAVWAHGTIIVYWMWALFLMAGKTLAG